ncbi:class I SAM-dependent DNA methyltransferase [Leptospira sp. GIMC2001]|uniref:class I SAM-dependent DNA methyltransferase n=1 Tax=Leptospira sp. GIMC2001 TaxID=1513297 RepID=UPI00234B41F9|nr:class I SAM-dependent methyltransferase [Leptospira sp. GIMC2001]WCL48427.1 class I SAM-dependent methyltransferase [Leptospira sp. GIMC2001]
MKSLKPYQIFAKIYDSSMIDVDYEEWSAYIWNCFRNFKLPRPQSLLDLGCGTGRLLVEMSPKFPISTGVDSSSDMLEIARARNLKKTQWIQSTIQDFIPDRSYDLVLATHTTINYLADPLELFTAMSKSLRVGGICFFDYSSLFNLQMNFHEKKFSEIHDNIKMEWTTFFSEKSKKIDVHLDFYDKISNEWFGTESHPQIYHTTEELVGLLEKMKFRILEIRGDYNSYTSLDRANLLHILAIKE